MNESLVLHDGKCVEECPVGGEWSSWGEWSDCSHTCGNGTHLKTRICNGPGECFGDDTGQIYRIVAPLINSVVIDIIAGTCENHEKIS